MGGRITFGAGCLFSIATATVARADGDVAATATVEPPVDAHPVGVLGYAALPGTIHVASAEPLPAGTVAFQLLGGYGYRKSLLSSAETLDRGIGDVAIAVGILPNLSVALSLDGRYDKHFHLNGPPDDGYVGDPHLLVRFGQKVGRNYLGAQVGVWVPGKDAPSIAASATSVDARLVGAIAAGPGTLDVHAGFRYDNSAKSVEHPEELSAADRVSLGVSDYHAALVGAAYTLPIGAKAYLAPEASADIFVGSGAPGPIVRGGVSAGVHLGDAFTLLAFVEGAKVPGLGYGDVAMGSVKLVPYEPIVTAGLGLQAHFGGPSHPGGSGGSGSVTKNDHPAEIPVVEYAALAGEVTDENGKPVAGATVTVKLKGTTGKAVTDDAGKWKVDQLPIGKTVGGKTELDDTTAELAIDVDNKKPARSQITLTRGDNTVPKLALEAVLPPGQLRAIVKMIGSGKPIAGASVKIEPGGKTATTDADGKFQLDLAPGQYKITATSPGLAPQQLDVTIDPNGVSIKNIELHK